MVIGSGGAGKSTFARELAMGTGLPLIHLDLHYWKPGWTPTPPDEWTERVRSLACEDRWIIDGNYAGSFAIRRERCDAIVFFDLPRLVCLAGVVRRRLRHRNESRPDLPEGCSERLDWNFVRWIWDFPRESRPRILEALASRGPEVELVTITRRSHARAVLDPISEHPQPGGSGVTRQPVADTPRSSSHGR
jgi:adenylate kinase family enzyme